MSALSDNLLATKLEMPPLAARVVRRGRLTERLQTGLAARLSLVVAPAGYGKTTLLGEWVIQGLPPGWRVAWVTLDGYDNELARFWSYVVGAIRKVYPGLKSRIQPLAQGEDGPHDFTLLEPLINELAVCPHWICLVIDDYHWITSAEVHQSLAYFIDHQPRNFHLVLASRMAPPIPLSRYRAQGQLVEVISRDLSFTPQEVDVFFRQVMDLEMGHEQVEALASATEGWAAGLKLAALSYGWAGAAGMRVDASGINPQTFDFLVEEVLSRQDADMRAFLLETAVLSEFSAPLCNAVLGRSDGQQMLEQVLRKNLFIFALDNEQTWYRYHHLFAETLRLLLERSSPESARELRQRACRWMRENGHPDKAVSYALDAGDLECAAQIIDACALDAVTHFNINRLTQWIGRLSPGLLEERPQLGIYVALAYHLMGRVGEARPRLAQVEQSLQRRAAEGKADQDQRFMTWQINVLRAVLKCLYGDTAEGIAQIIALRKESPEEDDYFSGNMTHILAESYAVTGQLGAALEEYRRGMDFAQKHGLCFEYAYSLTGHAAVLKMLGRLSEAEGDYHRMLAYAHDCTLSQTFDAYALSGLAEIALERYDLAAAGQWMGTVELNLQLMEQAPPTWIRREFVFTRLARYYLVRQDLVRAQAYFERSLERLAEKPTVPPFLAADLIDMYVRLWEGEDGDEASIMGWIEQLEGLIPYQRPFAMAEQCALARVQLAGGQADLAAETWEAVRAYAYRTGGRERELEALVMLARCALIRAERPAALACLDQALELAQPEGVMAPFAAQGEALRPLLEERLARLQDDPGQAGGPAATFCAQLLQALAPPPTAVPPTMTLSGMPRAIALAPLGEALSNREAEVAGLLAQGKSAKEIAGELVISIHTTKSHLQNIYRKLGVHTREDALRVMAEWGRG